jgi:hypothetical protein
MEKSSEFSILSSQFDFDIQYSLFSVRNSLRVLTPGIEKGDIGMKIADRKVLLASGFSV